MSYSCRFGSISSASQTRAFPLKLLFLPILGKFGFISWRLRPFFQLPWSRRNDPDCRAKMKAEKKHAQTTRVL
jgi:hypothetical protein